MKVIETKGVRRDDLFSLILGEAQVLRVPEFYDRRAALEIAERLETSSLRGSYENAPDIARIGKAYFERQASAQAALEYQVHSLNWISDLREAVRPYPAPMDQLRVCLDDVWAAGATLATIEGQRAFCGLVRIFAPGNRAEPHQDILSWDVAPDHPDGKLFCQLAANIYCKMPDEGGELEIWPISLTRPDYERLRIPGSYGVQVNELGLESIRIRPEPGELIIFNSRLVHAVRPGSGCDRVTSSCFIGVVDTSTPLRMWS